jgi:hypothetical protein
MIFLAELMAQNNVEFASDDVQSDEETLRPKSAFGENQDETLGDFIIESEDQDQEMDPTTENEVEINPTLNIELVIREGNADVEMSSSVVDNSSAPPPRRSLRLTEMKAKPKSPVTMALKNVKPHVNRFVHDSSSDTYTVKKSADKTYTVKKGADKTYTVKKDAGNTYTVKKPAPKKVVRKKVMAKKPGHTGKGKKKVPRKTQRKLVKNDEAAIPSKSKQPIVRKKSPKRPRINAQKTRG